MHRLCSQSTPQHRISKTRLSLIQVSLLVLSVLLYAANNWIRIPACHQHRQAYLLLTALSTVAEYYRPGSLTALYVKYRRLCRAPPYPAGSGTSAWMSDEQIAGATSRRLRSSLYRRMEARGSSWSYATRPSTTPNIDDDDDIPYFSYVPYMILQCSSTFLI